MNPQAETQVTMLQESIKHFLTSFHDGSRSSDFTSFESIFFRLIQTMLDPPLEITWFYSAVTYHTAKSGPQSDRSSARVLVAKDLLNLLTSCSNLSGTSKKIALLAPVVYELYNVVSDCRRRSVCVGAEVEGLVDNVMGYIMMCPGLYDCGAGAGELDNKLVCFEDLVRVWTADRGGGRCSVGENFRAFFPLLSEGVWSGMSEKGGVRELSGMVLCQVFFLKVYLSFRSGMTGEELVKDAAVRMIKGFQNVYFLEILLKMLLEPSLPPAALLSPEDSVSVRQALYDAIMVEYSFYSGRCNQLADNQSKRLALLWVVVANRAIQFARATDDQPRVISYLHSFHASQFVPTLVNWASNQGGIMDQNTRQDIPNPNALIKWLLNLEAQGHRVFEQSPSMLSLKALMSESVETGTPQCKKRKDGVTDVQEPRMKVLKTDLFGTCGDRRFSSEAGWLHGGEFNNTEDLMET